jgi:hypothetical protein
MVAEFQGHLTSWWSYQDIKGSNLPWVWYKIIKKYLRKLN